MIKITAGLLGSGYVIKRVNLLTVDTHLKVTVVTCGASCRAGKRNYLTLLYCVALRNKQLAVVSIEGSCSAAMVDKNVITVAGMMYGLDHLTCIRGVDICAVVAGNINT